MLKIFTFCSFTIITLLTGAACVYMQTANAVSNRNADGQNKSENQKRNDMKDIFKINETLEKSFPVNGKTVVKIYSFEGEITVRAANSPNVTMKATKMAVDKDAADGIKLDFSDRNGTIDLKADYVKPDRKIAHGKDYFYSKGAYVNWEIGLPAETDLILETGEGQIAVQGVSGEIKLTTKDGGITVKDCAGNLASTTYDGKVQITNYRGSADVTNHGDEPVLVEGDFQNLSVESGGGKIFLGFPRTGGGVLTADEATLSSKDFVLKKDGERYTFGTGNSNITVRANTGKVSIYSINN